MHLKHLHLAAILVAAPVFAQSGPSDIRIFHLVNIQSDASYDELVTTIKQITRVTPELPVDPASRTLTISASPDQLAVVDWIVNELDTKKAGSPEPGGAPKLHQFTTAEGDKVEIFYLDPAVKPQEFQEIITVLRQVLEVNRLFNYTARRAIVLQAPPDQAEASEWLIPRLALQEKAPVSDEYKMPGAPEDAVRIFRWNSALTPTQVQELTRTIRREAKVSRLFTVFNARALAVRGTPAQLSKASEIVSGPPPSL